MKSYLARIVIFGASLCLMACATAPPFNHLDAGARPHIKTVDSVLIAKQDRIGADISQNSTLSQIAGIVSGSTVIPVLVDLGVSGVRTLNANKLAKPMREELENHDYAWEFRKQIKQSLEGSRLGGVEEMALVREEYPGFRGQFIQQSDADAVLLVDMKYAFTKDFDSLYVTSLAMLFPNKPELREFQERPDKDRLIEYTDNIYRNQFAVAIGADVEEGTKSENAAYWASLSEEELVDLLETAGLLLSDKMASDLGIDDRTAEIIYDDDPTKIELGQEDIDAARSKQEAADEDLSTEPEPEEPEPETGIEIGLDAGELASETDS